MSADKIIDGKAFAAGLRERIGRETARLKAELLHRDDEDAFEGQIC